MATFTELCNDVYTITNRQDLVNETKLAVKVATLKMHQTDYYYKDLYETSLTFLSSSTTQSFDIVTQFPRYRALKYLRRYDTSGTGAAKEFFTILTPLELVDSYGLDKTNVAYVAGQVVQMKSLVSFDTILVGMYQHPIIDEGSYSSWIAAGYPYAILYEAARTLFKQIGFDEQAAAFDRLTQEQVVLLRQDNIQVEGY